MLDRLYSPLFSDVVQASMVLSYVVNEESPTNSTSNINILASQRWVTKLEFIEFFVSMHETMCYQLQL